MIAHSQKYSRHIGFAKPVQSHCEPCSCTGCRRQRRRTSRTRSTARGSSPRDGTRGHTHLRRRWRRGQRWIRASKATPAQTVRIHRFTPRICTTADARRRSTTAAGTRAAARGRPPRRPCSLAAGRRPRRGSGPRRTPPGSRTFGTLGKTSSRASRCACPLCSGDQHSNALVWTPECRFPSRESAPQARPGHCCASSTVKRREYQMTVGASPSSQTIAASVSTGV